MANIPIKFEDGVETDGSLAVDTISEKTASVGVTVDGVLLKDSGVLVSAINNSSLSASKALISDGSKNVISSSTTSTEIGYVSGVTSSIQTQLNGKQPSIATGVDNRIARYNGTGNIQGSGITVADSNSISGIVNIDTLSGKYVQSCITTSASPAHSVTQQGNSDVATGVYDNTTTGAVSPLVLSLQLSGYGSSTLPSSADYIRFGRGGNPEIGSISRGATTSSIAYNTTSDARLKNIIGESTGNLDKVLKLNVRVWEWRESGQVEEGFIAQEMYEQFPSCVRQGDESSDVVSVWGVDYGRLTPFLTSAIQELSAKLDNASALASQQQAIIETLLARIEALESK